MQNKERPIIFSGPMVRAILEGTKTQTRRAIKPQPDTTYNGEPYWHIGGLRWRPSGQPPAGNNPIRCPYGKPGDRLWVKETWNTVNPDGKPTSVLYKADGATIYQPFPSAEAGWKAEQDAEALNASRWNSPLFMPRWASRITLEVIEVRAHRVQEITEADAQAEGATARLRCLPAFGSDLRTGWSMDWSRIGTPSKYAHASEIKGRDTEPLEARDIALSSARFAFANYYNKVNRSKPGALTAWDANPWVWAVTFKRLQMEHG